MNNTYAVEIPLPNSQLCAVPTFLWPRNMTMDEPNCYCLPIETEHYSFRQCVQECQTEYDVTLLSDSVVFKNLNRTSRNFLVHFLCDEDPCTDTTCFMQSFMSSYTIDTEGNLQEYLVSYTIQVILRTPYTH